MADQHTPAAVPDEHDQPDAPDVPGAGDEQDESDLVGPAPRTSPRALTLSIGMLLTAVLLAVLVALPAPYAVSSPGPTRDVLGDVAGVALITIDGAQTYDSSGELRLVTVSSTGGPGYPSAVSRVLRGWFDPSTVVQPVELVFPPEVSQDEISQENTAAMVSSQENATVAALTELGHEVPAVLTVAGTVEGTDAAGKLEQDDVILAVDGTTLTTYTQLIDLLGDVTPGDTITLTVSRGGEEVDVPIVTGTSADGRAQIGVFIDPEFDLPVDVSIKIDDIGGSSAGTMFALGIIDKLTPQDEANGQVIAGTGTMDVTGEVGPIGGIRQKMAGALRDGAAWFLAPASNCDEVVDHVPDGLRVVKVETLHEAREAMTAIGAGTADDLPTCTAQDVPAAG
ncbi:YlbL family protein [Cellulomonas soli]|uniref:YlbL family protein n=1 Tax=Cellulomonas soli TaxID=931535 RepID=UPI003F8373AA